MANENENLLEILTLWKNTHQLETEKELNHALKVSDLIASFFCPGEFYYFILNFYDVSFDYVHPDVEKVVGCKPDDYNFGIIFEKMHPEDRPRTQLKETAAMQFFYQKLPLEKIPFYKSSYTFRIKGPNGDRKTILHQSIALQVNEAGKIQYVLCVHSDITFLNPNIDDQVSFIGLNGEPTYYATIGEQDEFQQNGDITLVSDREKEIIMLLAAGLSSKQIGGQLFISQHTVDTHRRNLLKKMGVQNTLELVAICLKKGLI